MFRTLVKTEAVEVEDQTFAVQYFELRTVRGLRRYSAEILLGPDDRIILDDDSSTSRRAPCGWYLRRFTAGCWPAPPSRQVSEGAQRQTPVRRRRASSQ
jgi:hypothetical protein